MLKELKKHTLKSTTILDQFSYLSRGWYVDETVDVNIDKSGHQELTVKSIHDSSMARNNVAKIFDFERTLESRSKETTKWSNDRSKERHEEAVDEERVEGDRFFHAEDPAPCGHGLWERILLRSEQCRGVAAHSHSLKFSAVLNWTDKIRNLRRIKIYQYCWTLC